jgi:transcriptional regulator with XRE-family HTH domain
MSKRVTITKAVKPKKEMPIEVIELGKRIKQVLEQKKLKQREVAHEANMDVENFRKYIKGKQEMKISTFLKIAKALKTETKNLLPF